jgi:hypothetical protein
MLILSKNVFRTPVGRYRKGPGTVSERTFIVSQEQEIQMECEALVDLLMRRYADRLTPAMVDGVRGSVEAVVKTVAAVRSVPLAHGDAPLLGFVPVRTDG